MIGNQKVRNILKGSDNGLITVLCGISLWENGNQWKTSVGVGGYVGGWVDGRADGRTDTWIWGPRAPMDLGLKERALCAPLLVSSVISRGAPRQMR
jgi:hypothetical protein